MKNTVPDQRSPTTSTDTFEANAPRVILSAFADESANSKSVVEQLAVLAALGLEYYSPRFVNVSGEVKNVMLLNKQELKTLLQLHGDYGMHVASIGSPIGKVKLFDFDDGTKNRYVPFAKYLKDDVATAIDRAIVLETRLIRGFSFYHPRGDDPMAHVAPAAEQLSAIVERCAESRVVYGLEVEANLVGQNGRLIAELARRVNHPNLLCIFDGGNISSQNFNAVQCFEEYAAMRKHVGWMHMKDYAIDPRLKWEGVVDEERLRNFVPVDRGDSGYESILRDFRAHLPKLTKKLEKLGVPGVFLELEPHLKGGGQFGGFSGPDGLGVACRALCHLLDYVNIDYRLRTFDHIRRARGF